jgi:hypothetical protein
MESTKEDLIFLRNKLYEVETTLGYIIPNKAGDRIKFVIGGFYDIEGLLLRKSKYKLIVMVEKVDGKEYFGQNPRTYLKQEIYLLGKSTLEVDMDILRNQRHWLFKDIWNILKEFQEEERKEIALECGFTRRFDLEMIEKNGR